MAKWPKMQRYFIMAAVVSSLLRAEDAASGPEPAGFQWKPALQQAGLFLGIQHGFRLGTEPGTRTQLRGPFVRDWTRSVRNVRGWSDGDPFIVNYVGHPMMGAVTGFIAVQNDPEYRRSQFGRNPQYWKSRLRALAFSTLYSTQFELGPVSEASIGNVHMHPPENGMVDFVVTPTFGLGWQIAEDALDRLLVRRIESSTDATWLRIMARGVLNPARSFSNLLRWKPPWYRDDRGGVRLP
jgi:hypothetical protein